MRTPRVMARFATFVVTSAIAIVSVKCVLRLVETGATTRRCCMSGYLTSVTESATNSVS
jgi:hypothetical protein